MFNFGLYPPEAGVCLLHIGLLYGGQVILQTATLLLVNFLVQHVIDTGDAAPICLQPSPVIFVQTAGGGREGLLQQA